MYEKLHGNKGLSKNYVHVSQPSSTPFTLITFQHIFALLDEPPNRTKRTIPLLPSSAKAHAQAGLSRF